MERYGVKNIVLEQQVGERKWRERLPVVIDKRTGIPLVEPLRFTLKHLRTSVAVNTVDQICDVLQLFYCWLESKTPQLTIELAAAGLPSEPPPGTHRVEYCFTQRIKTKGIILEPDDIDRLAYLYRLGAADFELSCQPTQRSEENRAARVVSLEKVRQSFRPKSKMLSQVGPEYVGIRLSYTKKYVEYLAMEYSGRLSLPKEIRESLQQTSSLNVIKLGALIPRLKQDDKAPEGLADEEWELLESIAHPGFAYFADETNTLVVVSENGNSINYLSPRMIMTTHAMEVAQDLGASFIVHGTEVICNIRGVSQAGGSYGEAALRAMLAYSREQTTEQRTFRNPP